MKKSSSAILTAAVSGLLLGGLTSCKSTDTETTTSQPAGAAKHACAGQNACAGQGGCKSGDQGCAGKNTCSGKGGCSTMDKQ